MRLVFSREAWEDYLYWHKTDRKMVERIHELIKDACRTPHSGIGKPEPLRHVMQGYWSRRIDQEHRFVYKVAGQVMLIAQLRHHYA